MASLANLNDSRVQVLINYPSLSAGTLAVKPLTAGVTGRVAISNSNALGVGDASYVDFVSAINAGGLSSQHKQTFVYCNGSPDTEVCDITPNGIFNCNRGTLDFQRVGSVTGTGIPQVIACQSIRATSTVRTAIVGCAAAGGFASFVGPTAAPVIGVIVPLTNFTITLEADLIYEYEVIG